MRDQTPLPLQGVSIEDGSAKFGNGYLEQVLKEMKAQMPIGYEANRNGLGERSKPSGNTRCWAY